MYPRAGKDLRRRECLWRPSWKIAAEVYWCAQEKGFSSCPTIINYFLIGGYVRLRRQSKLSCTPASEGFGHDREQTSAGAGPGSFHPDGNAGGGGHPRRPGGGRRAHLPELPG